VHLFAVGHPLIHHTPQNMATVLADHRDGLMVFWRTMTNIERGHLSLNIGFLRHIFGRQGAGGCATVYAGNRHEAAPRLGFTPPESAAKTLGGTE
jgi:hypothetical protein